MKRNNAVGVKGRSGRKTLAEEVRKVLDMDLCNELHNDRLILIRNKNTEDRTDQELKDFVVPVSLKGIVEKKLLSGELKVLSMDDSVKEKYEVASHPSTSSKGTK